MKKLRILFSVIFVFSVLLMISSCYTKRKGIVPCPHGKIENKTENPGDIRIEPV